MRWWGRVGWGCWLGGRQGLRRGWALVRRWVWTMAGSEVEGVRAPGEQADELGEQEGAGVAHGSQGVREGGDLGVEVVHAGDDPEAQAVKMTM